MDEPISPSHRTFTFEREKFIELMLYIAREEADDPRFGDTLLNKMLFFCDFLAYRQLGKPITGARYQKLPFGPAARALFPVREELVEDGEAHVRREGGTYARTITEPLRAPRLDLFERDELELIDEVIQQCRGVTATRMSAFSHRWSAGWNLVELNEDIPYETAFIRTEDPPQRVIDRGRELAAERGWGQQV